MSNLKLFTLCLFATACGALLFFYIKRPAPRPEISEISDHVFISSQLTPDDVNYVRRYYRPLAIIDLRPDGEANDQPNHSEIESVAKPWEIDFNYIPIPHESIPSEAIDALSNALQKHPDHVLLYCRSGRRAVRTYALAEASRFNGPSHQSILDMVQKAGFSADDLKDKIAERIAARHATSQASN